MPLRGPLGRRRCQYSASPATTFGPIVGPGHPRGVARLGAVTTPSLRLEGDAFAVRVALGRGGTARFLDLGASVLRAPPRRALSRSGYRGSQGVDASMSPAHKSASAVDGLQRTLLNETGIETTPKIDSERLLIASMRTGIQAIRLPRNT